MNYIYNYSGLTSIEPCTTLETAKLSFDPDKSELPDCAKVASVKKGMTMEEVNSVLGKPQRQITSGVLVVEYDLSNGEKLVVEYTLVGSALEVYSYQMEA